VEVVFPSWAPQPVEIIESQAETLALTAGDGDSPEDDLLPPETTKHGEAV
jgi:hypothetical protein